MPSPRRLVSRIAALLQRGRLERELENEIMAHLELAERDARAAGLSAGEARAEARRRFGGIDQMKEHHRDTRGVRWVETFLRDARYGIASLWRDPGFTLIAVAVLALGIGANSTMFSVVDAALLKPLPFRSPERIVRVWEAPRPGAVNGTTTVDFLEWKEMSRSFEALAAESSISAALTEVGEPVQLSGLAVTADYFRVFAVEPPLGRTFAAGEDREQASAVVVLSNGAWQKYFAGDPGILQRRIILDGEARQVIGVLPRSPFDHGEAEFWIPLVFSPNMMDRKNHWLTVVGRLRDGVTLAQARDDMDALNSALADTRAAHERELKIEVQSFESLTTNETQRRSLLVAFAAVVLVLLIACANVANLLLARGARRAREMAVRSALGASRGRLVAQLLTEVSVLCVLAAVAGTALASVTLGLAQPLVAEFVPTPMDVHLDARVMIFTGLVALVVTILTGIVPAVNVPVGNLVASLNQGARGSSSGRRGLTRRVIVAAEVALSFVLVCAALLMVLTLLNLQRIETGVRVEGVTTLSMSLPEHAYRSADRAVMFYQALAEGLAATPGVARAGLATALPLQWITNGEGIRVQGSQELIRVRFKRVDPGYFDVVSVPIIAGRGITTGDRQGSPIALVVNETLARRLKEVGRTTSPVGQQVALTSVGYERESKLMQAEVVGVIRSERVGDPWRPDPAVVYVPLAQAPSRDVKVLLAGSGDARTAIRNAAHAIDPNLPLGDLVTMQQVRDRLFRPVSGPASLLGAFAIMAICLTAVGLFGVLAQSVTEQRREIGIRLALGAESRTVLMQVVGAAFRLTAVGLGIGIAASLVVTRVMRTLLYGVSPVDGRALAVAAVTVLAVCLTAALIPARRAASTDAMVVLRDEG